MDYKKGDRVRHPKVEDWGLGEVLEDSNAEAVRVFFVGAGEKTLALKYVQPIKVTENTAHPVLDNLKLSKSSSGIKYQNLEQSKEWFRQNFPGGFYGERFKNERDYKVEAHELGMKLLGNTEFQRLIEAGDYPEISRRALKLLNATNLVFPNEKMALKDGLEGPENRRLFSHGLFDLLFGEGPLKERFEGFAAVLERLGAAKWTIVSYYLFIVHPDRYMFIKPTMTNHGAQLCGYEINYQPRLNWLTYKSVLDFAHYLNSELADLEPRDMIDVQSFMWCITPGTYS